ncbi:MAG: hypothetical protein ACI4AO_03600 [Anaerotignum sp.]
MDERDWGAIKNEYITGKESLTKLSEKYKVPLRTIKDRSRKEKWVEARKKFRTDTAQKASQKTMKKEAKRLARLRDVAEDVADLIGEDVEKLKELHRKRKSITPEDVKMIKDLTAALKNIADIMRDVYAIPTIREKLLLDKYKDYKKMLEDIEREEGGVILLAEPIEREEEDGENIAGDRAEEKDHLETAAETD